MSEQTTTTRRLMSILGAILIRVVVPAWIMTGAIFKLTTGSPRLLPKWILVEAHERGIDFNLILATLVAVEFAAIALLVLVRPLARLTATFMLVSFCLVLARSLMDGAANCGCLGAHSPSPWVMLAIDASMLLGVILLKPAKVPFIDDRTKWVWPVAGVLAVAGVAFAYWKLIPW